MRAYSPIVVNELVGLYNETVFGGFTRAMLSMCYKFNLEINYLIMYNIPCCYVVYVTFTFFIIFFLVHALLRLFSMM